MVLSKVHHLAVLTSAGRWSHRCSAETENNFFIDLLLTPRYHHLLEAVHQCYLDQRERLLSPSITSTITDLTGQDSKDHCALVSPLQPHWD